MPPIGRATFEFEEFLAACEYDLGRSSETAAFYRKKITRFLKWAQQEEAEALDAQAVRRFFRRYLGPLPRNTYLCLSARNDRKLRGLRKVPRV